MVFIVFVQELQTPAAAQLVKVILCGLNHAFAEQGQIGRREAASADPGVQVLGWWYGAHSLGEGSGFRSATEGATAKTCPIITQLPRTGVCLLECFHFRSERKSLIKNEKRRTSLRKCRRKSSMFQRLVCVHLIRFWAALNMFVFDRKDEDPEQKIEFKTRQGEIGVPLNDCLSKLMQYFGG